MSELIRVDTQEEFELNSCAILLRQYEKCILEKGCFTMVLSGGRTPERILDTLYNRYGDKINWELVHFFWLDERCVPPSHSESNYNLASKALISCLTNVGSVHRMKGELDPETGASEYLDELKMFFGTEEIKFDFVLIGMGIDGHVASIFPDFLYEIGNYNEVFATPKKYNGYYRISLNYSVINNSAIKLLLINNQEKLNVFLSNDDMFPIHFVRNTISLVLTSKY